MWLLSGKATSALICNRQVGFINLLKKANVKISCRKMDVFCIVYICILFVLYFYIVYIYKCIFTHCRRLCETTEIFVRIENVFFYLVFTLTHLVFGFLVFVYIFLFTGLRSNYFKRGIVCFWCFKIYIYDIDFILLKITGA